jgi:hypothetical protein
MTTTARACVLCALLPTAALAGGLLKVKYYEPPQDPGDRHAQFTISNTIPDRNEFGVIVFADPVPCKGQLAVRPEPDDTRLVAAEKGKPYTIMANYLAWNGSVRTTCQVAATLVPSADRYALSFGYDATRSTCTLELKQADAAGVFSVVPPDHVVQRENTQPFKQSGAFCAPMSAEQSARLVGGDAK